MEDQRTNTANRTRTKKRQKRWIIGGISVVVVLAVLFGLLRGKKETPQLDLADTTVLTYTDLQSTISASGTVESADSTTVYSTMAYPVMAVHVEVGDYVQAGDLLAELDDQSIRNQITSQQINLDLSVQSSLQQVQTARENYDNFKSGLDQGLNATLNSARTQADNAYTSYEKALTTYERYRDGLDKGENTTLIQAEAAYLSARDSLINANDSYEKLVEQCADAEEALEEARTDWEEADAALQALEEEMVPIAEQIAPLEEELKPLTRIPEEERTEDQMARIAELEAALAPLTPVRDELQAKIDDQEMTVYLMETTRDQAEATLTQTEAQRDSAEKSIGTAEQNFETQKASYNAAVTGVDNTLADYLTNVQNAWDAYQTALTALASTEKTVKEQLRSYENSLTGAEISANKASAEESLRQLNETLEDARITAPVAGTVTAVYAKVGGSGSGLLFVIEDVDHLIVKTSVKGYDVGTVAAGMKVRIRSDAIGDRKAEGTLTTIAPTSNKNSMGQTDTTGEAVFAAEVAVTTENSGLRIGMEANLDYILAEEAHVLAVPYDAVYEDEAGRTCILVAEPADDADHFTIRSIPVTTGLDDDLDIMVTGPEVREGLRVINEADSYLSLLDQTVLAGTGLHSDLISAMLGG